MDSFKNIFELLDRLQAEQSRTGLPDWSKLFPPKSSWWFLIDRYFATNPRIAAGYVQPIHPIHSQSEQKKIGELIHSADPHAMVTGWSYTLWDLIPWAKGELVEFTTIVGLPDPRVALDRLSKVFALAGACLRLGAVDARVGGDTETVSCVDQFAQYAGVSAGSGDRR